MATRHILKCVKAHYCFDGFTVDNESRGVELQSGVNDQRNSNEMNVAFGFVLIFLALFHYSTSLCYWDAWTRSYTCSPIYTNISRNCYDCLCEMVSECRSDLPCTDDGCGPLRITRQFWINAGRITMNNDKPNDEKAHIHCLKDPKCTFSVIESFMAKISRDCDGDGVITCEDYIRIHRLGARNCQNSLDDKDLIVLGKCLHGRKNL